MILCLSLWLTLKVGKCRSLHVLSLRENDLTELPEEIGQLEELTVLDVVGNRLQYLPASLARLKLDALWIDGAQVHTHTCVSSLPLLPPPQPEVQQNWARPRPVCVCSCGVHT